MKKCKSCQQVKDNNQFGTYQRKISFNNYKICFRIYCKNCMALKSKLWRQNNVDKVKQYNASDDHKQSYQRWLQNNQQKRQDYQKQYYLNHIDKFKTADKSDQRKISKNKYKQNRKKNDPAYKLRNNVSNAIYKALNKVKSNKAGQSILKYLNYTLQDLKLHLESKFNQCMNWSNYGQYWHIDHITPQSDLPYFSMEDINFKLCWSLDNLRPLEAKINIIEGARRIRHKKT